MLKRSWRAIRRPKWVLKLLQVTLHVFNLSSHPINQPMVLWSIIELSNDARIVESAINSPQLAVQRNQFMPQFINLFLRVHTQLSENTVCRVGRLTPKAHFPCHKCI